MVTIIEWDVDAWKSEGSFEENLVSISTSKITCLILSSKADPFSRCQVTKPKYFDKDGPYRCGKLSIVAFKEAVQSVILQNDRKHWEFYLTYVF